VACLHLSDDQSLIDELVKRVWQCNEILSQKMREYCAALPWEYPMVVSGGKSRGRR
jgi:hypothetical protein